MADDRKKLDAYIKATDKRVDNWSTAQRDAFREATKGLTHRSATVRAPAKGSKSISEPPKHR